MRTRSGSTSKYSATPAHTPAMCPSSGRRRSRRGPPAGGVGGGAAPRSEVGSLAPLSGHPGLVTIGDGPEQGGGAGGHPSGGPDVRGWAPVGSSDDDGHPVAPVRAPAPAAPGARARG